MIKHNLKINFIIKQLLFCICFFTFTVNVNSAILKGKIFDSLSNQALSRVSIRVLDTNYGTYSNLKGDYVLNLKKGSYKIKFSMIGYQSITQSIQIDKDSINQDVYLLLAKFETGQITVFAEDEATRLMRKVIAKKLKQLELIENYSYKLYTKFVASTDTLTAGRTDEAKDTTINSILESYSRGYFKKPDLFFNEIYQKRQSVNVPQEANFVAFGTNLNAYDNFLTFLNEEVYTPFHPDAVDFYKFEIIGYQSTDKSLDNSENQKLTKIKFTALSNNRKLFNGTMLINEEELIPYSINLIPNQAVALPFDAKLEYEQEFEKVLDKDSNVFIVPSRMRIFSTLDAKLFWIVAPRLDILIETAAYDYQINTQINSYLFEQRRVEQNDSADKFNQKFWDENQLIPLRESEKKAYEQIRMAQENPDSLNGTSFLDELIRPINKTLGRLNRKPFTGFEDIFKYNRVFGMYLGIGLEDKIFSNTRIRANVGYGFSDEKTYLNLELKQFLDQTNNWNLDFKIYDNLKRRDKDFIIPERAVTFLSLLFKNDYGDYYYAKGLELGLEYSIGQLRFFRNDVFIRPTRFRLFWKKEDEKTALVNTNFALFGKNRSFRENPEIFNGNLQTIGTSIDYMYHPARRFSNFGFHFDVEISNPKLLESDFKFEQYYAELRFKSKTLALWNLDIKLSAGITKGAAAPQRLYSFETSASNTVSSRAFRTMLVKEFYGDRFLTMNLDHNFGEIIPGVLRIPNIASFGIEFIAFYNVGVSSISLQTKEKFKDILKTQKSIDESPDQIYQEIGLGLNKILLFFRTDFTIGFGKHSQPRFLFTISGSTF